MRSYVKKPANEEAKDEQQRPSSSAATTMSTLRATEVDDEVAAFQQEVRNRSRSASLRTQQLHYQHHQRARSSSSVGIVAEIGGAGAHHSRSMSTPLAPNLSLLDLPNRRRTSSIKVLRETMGEEYFDY